MSLLLPSRCLTRERMDTEALSLADMTPILKALETINLHLGGVRATLSLLTRFSRRWRPGERIRLIDWGTGGADVPRAIIRWARTKGFQLEIVAVDNNPVVIEYARIACQAYPEIKILQSDALMDRHSPRSQAGNPPIDPLPESAGDDGFTFDYAISSLTLHHLSDDQIIALLRHSDQVARRGLIMNDLKRSSRAWAWIWVLSRLGRAHPVVQHDGPLSVRRAFTRTELLALAQTAGLPYLKVTTHFGYRFILAGEKG